MGRKTDLLAQVVLQAMDAVRRHRLFGYIMPQTNSEGKCFFGYSAAGVGGSLLQPAFDVASLPLDSVADRAQTLAGFNLQDLDPQRHRRIVARYAAEAPHQLIQ